MLNGARALHATRALGALVACALMAPGMAMAGDPLSHSLRLGGEVSATLGPRDSGGFNLTDYNRNLLRLFRARLSAELLLPPHLALLGEVRSDDMDTPRVYALYLRLRPWSERALDFQAGRIPPVFGAYPRRRYASSDPLPGVPLVFQYLTTLHAESLPRTADELIARRSAAPASYYGTSAYEATTGLAFVDSERWDAGVQMRVGTEPLSLALALTQGSLSRPLVRDDNDGKQLAGRVEWHPAPAWSFGASAAVGDYLQRRALAQAGVSGSSRQSALGGDAGFAYGHWILRGEAVWSRWDLPTAVSPGGFVSGTGGFLEARYKVAPGVSLAARVGHLGFSRLSTTQGQVSWDAPLTRVEAGVAWAIRRHLSLKAAYQGNWRDGGRVRRQSAAVGQVVAWF